MTLEKHGWMKLFLVLTACYYCRCLQVSIPQPQYEAARGSNINLPCSFSPARPDYEMFILKWEIVQDNKATTMAIFYSNLNQVDISPDYEGRISLNVDAAKRESVLHLTKVTIEDNGNYQCNVMIPGDDEGTPSASTFVLVLVAPSPPICQIQGTAEYWHNITLTCMSEEGSPKPLYEWKSYSVENIPRSFPPKTTEKNGALSLFNISREMSGFYICTSTNQIGSASCNFTLAVLPGGSMSGATAGIIGGAVAAVLLLAILIFCCCRNKNKKAKYTEGSPGEMEFCDRDDAETSDEYRENKSDKAQKIQYQEKGTDEQNRGSEKTALDKLDDDQHSYNNGKERNEDRESNTDSHRFQGNYRGSQDQLDEHYKYRDINGNRNLRYGSHDRLDDGPDHYRDSRDRLNDNRDQYRGSRDRLDDSRDQYRGSRDRLDDSRDQYRGSRDRLDDNRDQYRGSRDRLDDNRDQYRGSRDRLDDNHDQYRGSRDRLDDNRDQYRGSRDRLDDNRDQYRGSRDRLDDNRDQYRGSRDRLDYTERGRFE